MTRDQRAIDRSRRERHGLLDSLLGGASGIVQSVANEVAPGVVSALDVDEVVQGVDIQAVMDRVDLQALLERIDLNALLEDVDIDRLLQRVDLNAVLQRVDIDAIVEQTEFGTLMARSGSAVMNQVVDMVRSQGVGLDSFVHRWVDRVLRRDGGARPSSSPLLPTPEPQP